ncbi:ribonuclease III [Aaosphaeria arxii CBS 175.79]|uniref:Ribonuclease III n=1 Tax=Aaosphaeria arxii CBS 175.79 TaxID=1450172 RepID=A0A6A5X749_9PLEO|nr:ribonuclease III [Aaosphaeria arxii CBS 175.79]KAF2008768.1 ribonuclease III [Aaosphaeria arxii CBS 175.79]
MDRRGGGPPANKRHKPNNFGAPQGKNGIQGGSSNHSNPRPQHQNKDKSNPLDLLERLPNPKDCVRCKLSASERENGLIALLDQLVHDESGPEADTSILQHAQQLRASLSKRATANSLPSQLKQHLDQKRPETEKYVVVPSYIETRLNRAKAVPPLPPITEPYLEEAVFTHTSANYTALARRTLNDAINYERLEFLGDAYIELVASRLIYSRFPHLDPAKQSYFRENLVKNETLQVFSEAYGFPDRLKHGGHTDMSGQKHWTKVQADVFEAYVAAVVLSDPEDGYRTAEQWLTELWAPKLLEYKEAPVENPKARDEINKLLMAKGIKLDYRMARDMQMVDGLQRFFIDLYLTGWGFENQLLGSGEAQNKSQACVFAAMDALQNRMDIVMKANAKKLEVYPPKPKENPETAEPKKQGKPEEKAEKDRTEEKALDSSEEDEKKRRKREKKDKKKRKELAS